MCGCVYLCAGLCERKFPIGVEAPPWAPRAQEISEQVCEIGGVCICVCERAFVACESSHHAKLCALECFMWPENDFDMRKFEF